MAGQHCTLAIMKIGRCSLRAVEWLSGLWAKSRSASADFVLSGVGLSSRRIKSIWSKNLMQVDALQIICGFGERNKLSINQQCQNRAASSGEIEMSDKESLKMKQKIGRNDDNMAKKLERFTVTKC